MTASPSTTNRLDSRPLSDEQWSLLMREPGHAAELADYDGPNRRHEPRTEHREVMHVFFSLSGKGEQRFLVRARDLSPSGLRFVHSQPLPIDASCRVALMTKGQKLVHRDAIVCTANETGGTFEIGLRLSKPVKVEQFVSTQA